MRRWDEEDVVGCLALLWLAFCAACGVLVAYAAVHFIVMYW